MASIRKVIELGAPPDAVWDALADFQAVHEAWPRAS
jgi:carbon monoxide dehydrogenase subunit G